MKVRGAPRPSCLVLRMFPPMALAWVRRSRAAKSLALRSSASVSESAPLSICRYASLKKASSFCGLRKTNSGFGEGEGSPEFLEESHFLLGEAHGPRRFPKGVLVEGGASARGAAPVPDDRVGDQYDDGDRDDYEDARARPGSAGPARGIEAARADLGEGCRWDHDSGSDSRIAAKKLRIRGRTSYSARSPISTASLCSKASVSCRRTPLKAP